MPLVIVEDGHIDRPVVVCDRCGQVIADAEDGNYYWRHGDTPMVIYFTHKKCSLTFEKTHDNGRSWCWIPLEALPYFLANNLQVSWQKSRACADLMSR